MIHDDDIISEGFRPLKKTITEPTNLATKNNAVTSTVSINPDTGERQNVQVLWEGSSWEKFGRSRGKTMDRANSFIGGTSNGVKNIEEKIREKCAVAIVDPFSTGAHLAAEVCKLGYKCVRVMSTWDSPVSSLVQEGIVVDYVATVQHNDLKADQHSAVFDTVNSIRDLPFEILAVIPGAETGVELADQLSFHLKLRTNGINGSAARRNKYLMGEKVRNAGVRAVKQSSVTSIKELHNFLNEFPSDIPLKCVLKPVQSAGTDDVFLCSNVEEAEIAFNRIIGKRNGIGLINDCVLAQEYLIGKEYVVDKVSRDGVHKLVAIWEYDKRSVNGANFVYFGMRLKPSTSAMATIMSTYADKVLDALDIMHGPSHMEIMVNTITRQKRNASTGLDKTETEYLPCLVEVGARCHGGEGTWLAAASECVGYNQVTVTLDAYLEGKLFNSIDKYNFPLKKAAREVDLVSRYSGIVRSLPGDALIRNLASFRSINWEVKPGDFIPITIDCFTRPGCVQLVNDSETAVEKDFEAIHDLEETGLIDYAVICPKAPSIGCIVVVDPFSSGANLAAMVLKWGYKLILVFSEKESPVAKLVTKGTHLNPTLIIQHDNTHPNQVFAISQTIAAIDSQSSPVLAIIPGAETGVELAELMAYQYGTRNNGMQHFESRRNKYNMQETIRSAGVRAIHQKLCRSEAEVCEFYSGLKALGSEKCVIKPNLSAGTDSVYLCTTVEEALVGFKKIHNHVNGLGQLNDGALCQEFLVGTEYVVDGVSRDGIYKVTAIWKYDKRSINGANFVYFGMTLLERQTSPEVSSLIDYAKKVVTALGIKHGPSHMEIMLNVVTRKVFYASTGVDEEVKEYLPCLVEVGSRCHGGEGTWLPIVNECIGYSQLDATLNCYLRPDRFESLPDEPSLTKFGCEAFLISYSEGVLQDIPGIDSIRTLSSFRRMEMMTQPGNTLFRTIDCFTRPGSVQLVNSDKSKLQIDYETIRSLEKDGLFAL